MQWLLAEARKRGFKVDPKRARREAILRKLGYAAMGLVGAWMLMGFLFLSATSCQPLREWQREQKLLACLQEATNNLAVMNCTHYWGRKTKSDQRRD